MTGLVERRRRWFVCCLSKRKLDGIASTRCVQVLYAKVGVSFLIDWVAMNLERDRFAFFSTFAGSPEAGRELLQLAGIKKLS
ncbi:hypothetical protein PC123_g27334 [Phytophthora cactorum]|nr:hypothetical protein PC123_g27334 [Phytophthora cactorum]